MVDFKKINPTPEQLERIEEVLTVIETIKDEYEESPLHTEHEVAPERYFRNGGCAYFHFLLKSYFPEAKMRVTHGCSHVLTEIDDILYDICGVYEDIYGYDEDDLKIYGEDIPEVAQKFINGYAFSINASSFWCDGGPTGACMFKTFEEATQEEIQEAFKFLGPRGLSYMPDSYRDYKRNPDFQERIKREIEGLIFPCAV